jgi:hypothetical protein
MHLSRDDYLSPTSLGGKLRVPLAARMLLSVARDTDRGAGAGARPGNPDCGDVRKRMKRW